MSVSKQINPWIDWAFSWSTAIYQTRICMQRKQNGNPGSTVFVNMITPKVLSPATLKPIRLFWDRETIFTLDFAEPEKIPCPSPDVLDTIKQITALYLRESKPQHQCSDQDFVMLFSPDQPLNTLGNWLSDNSGSETALQAYARGLGTANIGIVHDGTRYNEPLIFKKWVYSRESTTMRPDLKLECEQISHRRKLLCRSVESGEELPPIPTTKARVVPAQACTVAKLPFVRSIFGLFVPAIVSTLERRLLAARLCNTILRDIGFETLDHVVTAITTPFTRSRMHYQRYEFFGDSVLKYIVSYQLFCRYPDWHEHDLTRGRDELVQNPRLTRAAVKVGLDAFVIDRRQNPRKCSVHFISQPFQDGSKKRDMSAKVLADVIEALIGAAYVDGGPCRARACIQRLLPEIMLQKLDTQSNLDAVPDPSSFKEVTVDEALKRCLGYTFINVSLLVEALTHPSCYTTSYQRLEFLGDAVLDMVIVDHFIRNPVEISQGEMSLIKHAVSNGNLLAFLCLEFTPCTSRSNVYANIYSRPAISHEEEGFGLWRFMRFNNPSLTSSQDAVFKRYLSLRDQIILGLRQSEQYPWQALCELNADKYFSDIVESTLGAIFVDSGGDLSACETFLERIGLLEYFRRILVNGISVIHPKNAVQMLSKSLARFTLKHFNTNGASDARYDCAVDINGARIALVKGCLCRAEAEVKAANAAIEFLRQTPLDALIPS
ncbi:ribonuclease III domain-containing protein [Aspergillus varians]